MRKRRLEYEADRWNREYYEEANARMLDRLEIEDRIGKLERDITALNSVENKYEEVKPSDAPLVPCPICHSVRYLVEGYAHPKVLICERPNCVYERASRRVASFRLREVINE